MATKTKPAPRARPRIKPFWTIAQGDALDLVRQLPDCSIDAVVVDPPYGLSKDPDIAEVMRHWVAGDDYLHRGGGFMGKTWDSFVPGPAVWREALRVLKPGGHLLCFAGTRTSDLMSISIRFGGFEIRDCLMWLYGTGFPKSLDVSKAIDKAARRVAEAQDWSGWGTALKPAYEPIVLARRPPVGTVASNVMAHGTGALNIDGCRIATTDSLGGGAEKDVQSDKPEGWDRPWRSDPEAQAAHAARVRANVQKAEELGRWPANVLLDLDAATILDEQTSHLESGGDLTGNEPTSNGFSGPVYGNGKGRRAWKAHGDSGGASRFFYCSKTSKQERDAGLAEYLPRTRDARKRHQQDASERWIKRARNLHPTVKPIQLMRWLVRLVTPPGGVVLDLFAGSGTTLCAAVMEGFSCVGFERDREYVELARARTAYWASAE